MLKAALTGSAVTFALIAIPVVHFITAIPSPFIGGYMAGARAEADGGVAFALGLLMAGMLVVPIIGVVMLTNLLLGFGGTGFVIVSAGTFAAYVFLAASVGAAIGGAQARRQNRS